MATRVPLRVRLRAGCCAAVFLAAVCALCQPAQALSTIIIEEPTPPVLPGDTFSFLVRISGSTPLVAYTVDLRVTPHPGAAGSIVGNAMLSNFYPSANLFTIGGNGIDAGYSGIDSQLPSNPGLMINALDSSIVATAVPGAGQDVLAEVVMTASLDALGDFDVWLGPGTTLVVDGNEANNEPYPPALITIHVPEPGYLGVLAGIAITAVRRGRKRAE